MSGGGGGNDEARKARKAEEKRQARIRKGTARIDNIFDRNFDPAFYEGREDAYRDYATPQVDRQYRDASDDLAYHLARTGGLDSSTRATKEAELGELRDLERQKVESDALQQGTDARTRVEDARTDLITVLQATGNAQGAAQGALNRAGALSRPESFSPLQDLFLRFTAGLGNQAALERAYAAGGPAPRYNTGLFGPGRDAVKVT